MVTCGWVEPVAGWSLELRLSGLWIAGAGLGVGRSPATVSSSVEGRAVAGSIPVSRSGKAPASTGLFLFWVPISGTKDGSELCEAIFGLRNTITF